MRALRDKSHVVRLPQNLQVDMTQIRKARYRYAVENQGHSPSDTQLAEMLSWPAIEALVIACRANAALCALKLGRNSLALAHCDAALNLPGGHSCGKSLLSKLLLRRLTALVEMSEDPLEEVHPSELTRSMRDVLKRGLATGKHAPAAKSFASVHW